MGILIRVDHKGELAIPRADFLSPCLRAYPENLAAVALRLRSMAATFHRVKSAWQDLGDFLDTTPLLRFVEHKTGRRLAADSAL